MSATVIQYDAYRREVRRGQSCLAFCHIWKMPDGTFQKGWFRGSNLLAGEESVAVCSAIMTSASDISGEELTQKIQAHLESRNNNFAPTRGRDEQRINSYPYQS